MRAAPPVSVRCSGGLPWRVLNTGLPALAAAALAAWALGHAELPVAWALGVLPLAAAGAWPLTARTAVDLRWDGQCWTADGVPGALDVMIDAGAGLLLRLRPEAPASPLWIAVTAGEAAGAMHALRAAAYARPRGGAADAVRGGLPGRG